MNFSTRKLAEPGLDRPGGTTTFIANGTVFTGNLVSKSDLRIDGEVLGNIECESKVVIGPAGVVEGEIRCPQADVSGRVTGNVYCADSLLLRKQAQLRGNIYTNLLQMDAGVQFNGECKMGELVEAKKMHVA